MIILQDLEGNRREVEEGVPYRPKVGERVIGSTTTYADNVLQDGIKEAAAKEGVPYGDYIAKLTKLFGIQPCSSCQQRQQILNKVNEIGWAEAMKLVKDTFK